MPKSEGVPGSEDPLSKTKQPETNYNFRAVQLSRASRLGILAQALPNKKEAELHPLVRTGFLVGVSAVYFLHAHQISAFNALFGVAKVVSQS